MPDTSPTTPPARTRLATHEVSNQPPPYRPGNLYSDDAALRAAVRREAGDWLDEKMLALGAAVATPEMLELGELANRHPPELFAFDPCGRRIDEVRFHPAYHRLMTLAMAHRIHDLAWVNEDQPGAHLGHLAPLAVFTQAEAGVMCPVDMSYAAVASLRRAGGPIAGAWLDKLIGGQYDPALRPLARKAGVTIGMAMTEKQGGSDVRANSTRAEPAGDGGWRLTGHKWFCSAPMSDAFLTLARTPAGLSCFLAPRVTPDGELNAINLMRLKDKLGNRSNASAEIEYEGAFAWLLGEEGDGVPAIIEMVHHTRLGTSASTIGIMRAALARALHHCRHRTAFQKHLIDQPAMAAVLADLTLEYEAAVVLGARVAAAYGKPDAAARAFARLGVALTKYWLSKRCPAFVYECLECHGGNGYIEDGPMPRLFRESPVNAIWEGSGNVIALDILRTLAREPLAIETYAAELALARGGDRRLDAAAEALLARLTHPVAEGEARGIAQTMALLLQAALLVHHAPAAIADAFVATRIAAGPPALFGALPGGGDVAKILNRQ